MFNEPVFDLLELYCNVILVDHELLRGNKSADDFFAHFYCFLAFQNAGEHRDAVFSGGRVGQS